MKWHNNRDSEALEKLTKEGGEEGKRKMNKYTKIMYKVAKWWIFMHEKWKKTLLFHLEI